MGIIQGLFLDDGYQAVMDRINKERLEARKKELELINTKEDKLKLKKDKFNRLINKRLIKAIKAVRLLKNLSNKSHYLSKTDELDIIIKTCKKSARDNIKKFKV